MSVEIWCLLYVAALPLVIGWLSGVAKLQSAGLKAVWERRSAISLEGWGARSERAIANLHESLYLFFAVVIAIELTGASNTVTQTGAIVFAVVRTVHAFTLIVGLQPWRSLSYMVALAAVIAMVFQLVR